jgi:hypothetical protein
VEAQDGGQYGLALADMSTRLRENLERTREVLPAYFNEAGIDSLQGVTFDPAVDCRFDGYLRMPDSAETATWLVAARCDDDINMTPVSTYLVIPPA